MAARQPQTNLDDVLNEIRVMNQRIGALEQWKIATDAAQAAVEKYKADEAAAAQQNLSTKEARTKTEVLKQTGYVLALAAAILYGIAASRHWL